MTIKKKVLIIDDNLDTCREIQSVLQDEVTDVGYALSRNDFFEQLKHPMVCLVIMDIQFAEIDGFQLIRNILQVRSIPILVLSSSPEYADRLSAFRAGAHGYINKPYELEECVVYAHSLMTLYVDLNKDKRRSYTLIYDDDFLIDPNRHQVSINGALLNFTPKEFDLLYYLANNADQVLSCGQIYSAVWHAEPDSNINEMVKVHIKAIRKKLAVYGSNHIRNEWGIGYSFSSKPL